MSKEIEANYYQEYIFPVRLEDWVDKGHPARFIRAIVDELRIDEMGFKVNKNDEGRPCYAAKMLLRIWLYGLFNRVYSSRGLEQACRDNVGMIWLAGTYVPDHNTLWRFFKNNKDKIKNLFKLVLNIALRLDMVKNVLHAIDGTKIAANVSRKNTISKADLEYIIEHIDEIVKERIEEVYNIMKKERRIDVNLPSRLSNKEHLKKLISEEVSRCEAGGLGIDEVKERVKEVIEDKKDELSKEGLKCKSETDNDARMMKSGTGNIYAYNAQAVVDKENKIIVACEVVNEEWDRNQLVNMLDKTNEQIGRVADLTTSDGGYFSGEELQKAEEKGYEVSINIPNRIKEEERIKNRYDVSNFTYDENLKAYICPEGNILKYKKDVIRKGARKERRYRIYKCVNFKNCPMKDKCNSSGRARVIEVSIYHEAIERQKRKQKLAKYISALNSRKGIIEHVFAIIKHRMGFRRWTVRGLNNVKAQWNLICTVYNLKKIYKVLLNNGNLEAIRLAI